MTQIDDNALKALEPKQAVLYKSDLKSDIAWATIEERVASVIGYPEGACLWWAQVWTEGGAELKERVFDEDTFKGIVADIATAKARKGNKDQATPVPATVRITQYLMPYEKE